MNPTESKKAKEKLLEAFDHFLLRTKSDIELRSEGAQKDKTEIWGTGFGEAFIKGLRERLKKENLTKR